MEEKYNVFCDLVKDQFAYGGKKYALSTSATKESTDVLFEIYGKNWLFGTMAKYIFRYRNLARERDLLKVATYCYIMWLKRGFFLKPEGTEEIIDTNVQIKTSFFDNFIAKVKATDFELIKDVDLYGAEAILKTFAETEFFHINEKDIIKLFDCMYNEWLNSFSDKAGMDKDTWNKENFNGTKKC